MTDPTPTRAEVLLRRLREPAFGTETTERNLMAEAADLIEALRERVEAAEAEAYNWECQSEAHFDAWRAAKRRFDAAEAALTESREMGECQVFSAGYEAGQAAAEAAAWNDAIEAAAMKAYGTGWANRIRALRRAAPKEGEA